MGRRTGAVLFSAVVLFLFFPVLVIVPLSFGDGAFLRFPPEGYGLRWYREYISDPVWMDATWRSLRIATLASSLATLCGTLAVVWLGRSRSLWRGPLNALMLAPAIVPNVVVALGVFVLALRLGASGQEHTLVLAHAALGVPFVVLIVGAAMRQVDPALERAARVMGAGPIRAFVHATLPSLLPAVAAAFIFAFYISFDELIVALFVSGGAVTLPVRIWTDLRFEINPTVAAVATLFVGFTTLGMGLAEWLRRRSVAQG